MTASLWSADRLVYTDDGLLHLFRVAALDRALADGLVYPRWLFDLAFGYGYPIFNYYPPLGAYLAETLHLLGFGFGAAINGAFILIVAVALAGAYHLGTQSFANSVKRRKAGILTATAYVFSPYFVVNLYYRGALAEALAAALLPWVIWALGRAIMWRTAGSAVVVGTLLAAVLLAHSLTLLMAVPVLIVYALFQLFRLPAVARIQAFRVLVRGTVLGAGLGAMYAVPFVLELPLVRMGSGIDEIRGFFQTTVHFQTPATLVQSTWSYGYGKAPFALGRVQVLAGVAALVAVLGAGRKFRERALVALWALGAVAAALLMLQDSRELWQTVPFATMVQYPWRVSALIGLGLAIVTGALPVALEHIIVPRSAIHAITGLVGVALVWSALASLNPPFVFLQPGELTPGQSARFEQISGFVGTTTFGEYLPANVSPVSLINHTPTEPPVARVPEPEIRLLKYGATDRLMAISAREPVSITLRAFNFPGWTARVDGRPVPVYTSTPTGLITADVPPGEHRLEFALTNTVTQTAGDLVSLIFVIALFLVGARSVRQRDPATRSVQITLLGAFAVVGAVLGSSAIANICTRPARPETPQAVSLNFGPGLQALGWTVDGAKAEPDGWSIASPPAQLHITVYWRARQSLPDDLFEWELVDETGRVWGERKQGARYATGAPALWIPNEIIQDQFDLPLDPNLPPGRYSVQGALGETEPVVLGALRLGRPPPPVEPVPTHNIHAYGDNHVEFLGFDAPASVQTGKSFTLALYWRAARSVPEDWTGFVQIRGVNGKLWAQPGYEGMQFEGLYPTSVWIPRWTVVDKRSVILPSTVRPGVYNLAVGMTRYPDGAVLPIAAEPDGDTEDYVVVGQITVRAEPSIPAFP